MSLLTVIPTEVIYNNVFPYLKWNDLLRFRRVCTAGKVLADDYITKGKGKALIPEIEITDFEDRSMASFLRLAFPAHRIFLNNKKSGKGMFEHQHPAFVQFQRTYGSGITHVRVDHLTSLFWDKEMDFYESLINLESLVVDNLTTMSPMEKLGKQKAENYQSRIPVEGHVYPSTFNNLKFIKLMSEGYFEDVKFTVGNLVLASMEIVTSCDQLEYAADAYSSFIIDIPSNFRSDILTLSGVFITIRDDIILHRKKMYPDKPNLKFYDFLTFHDEKNDTGVDIEWENSPKFLDLTRVCVENGVKLLNVDAAWFSRLPQDPQFRFLGTAVVSLVNLHPSVFILDLGNLERIVIRGTSRCGLMRTWEQDRSEWGALKSLDITVDSLKLKSCTLIRGRQLNNSSTRLPSTELLRFFFVGIRRIGVVELRLAFDKIELKGKELPRAKQFAECCPNLKRLTLKKWPGTNKALVELWEGWGGLEEICLEECRGLGNVGFVGENADRPVFFNLKRLKKLSLKGLDKMPKVTDTLFNLILCHLGLSDFLIESKAPLTNVTIEGIRALTTGQFAKSIEKFPFCGWSLANVSEEDFGELETQFRSYYMI